MLTLRFLSWFLLVQTVSPVRALRFLLLVPVRIQCGSREAAVPERVPHHTPADARIYPNAASLFDWIIRRPLVSQADRDAAIVTAAEPNRENMLTLSRTLVCRPHVPEAFVSRQVMSHL